MGTGRRDTCFIPDYPLFRFDYPLLRVCDESGSPKIENKGRFQNTSPSPNACAWLRCVVSWHRQRRGKFNIWCDRPGSPSEGAGSSNVIQRDRLMRGCVNICYESGSPKEGASVRYLGPRHLTRGMFRICHESGSPKQETALKHMGRLMRGRA